MSDPLSPATQAAVDAPADGETEKPRRAREPIGSRAERRKSEAQARSERSREEDQMVDDAIRENLRLHGA
jgi:hypothetical protein